LSTAVLNALFDLGWPLWGPALFAAVAIAAVTALFWLTEDSAWILLGLAVVSGSLGLWFKTRYGEAFSQPTQMWQNVTFTEVVTMLAFAVVAYGVGVIGISRHRRSEPLPSLGVVAALDQLFKLAPYAGPPFRSAFQAHAWFEWRKKGSAMPASVILGLMLGLCGWLLFNRTAQGLTESVLVGGGLLSAVAMICGLIMGNCGATDTTYEIGTFLASRPLTTVEMSRATLRAAAKSVLLSWLIWAAAFFAVYFIVLVVASPMCPFPRGLDWAYVPATLIAAWTVMGLLTSLGLAGRSQWVMVLLCGLPALYIGLALFSKFALSRSGQELFVQCVASATAVAAMLATTWMFVAARRRRLIEWITIYVAASLWVALAALMGIADVWHVWQRPVLYVALVGIGALALAPLAAAPLALAWNRSR
ncbi:MAG TPA: hypothetical protein VHC22_03885, partial [Pirellulales bacterium]|nr:hypothetical protein [Pirellulales bacterium]